MCACVSHVMCCDLMCECMHCVLHVCMHACNMCLHVHVCVCTYKDLDREMHRLLSSESLSKDGEKADD